MNLKTKAFGLVAGTALALTLVTGAMAQDTSVTLEDGAPCAATLSGGNIDFGTWTWDGDSYVNSVPASGSLNVAVTNAVFGVDECDVTLDVSDLTGDITLAVIPAADITLLAGAVTGNVFTFAQNTPTNAVAVSLDTDLDTYDPDVFTGTITVTSAEAAA